ncbi:MAG: hypothetical protein HYU36_15120 [Planctomycetes bacterium]|nr:hypothetical protein [Planctomycetota bacterium]
MRPRILVTADKIDGLRCLAEVKESLQTGHLQRLSAELLEKVETESRRPPYVPSSVFPGRDPDQARHGNRDYTVVAAAGERIVDAALAALLTGHARWRDAALEQMESLFDETRWPEWRDKSHSWVAADLRTGQLSEAIALAYDWLCPLLAESQRCWILEGLDRCGVRRYLKSVEEKAWWLDQKTNWQTCVVGGLGIAGMALGEDHPDSERLINLSLGRMRDYLSVYGPEGEFNENVGYASATLSPVVYFSAYRYYNAGVFGHNVLMLGGGKWRPERIAGQRSWPRSSTTRKGASG